MASQKNRVESVRACGKQWRIYVTRNMSFWHQSLCASSYYSKVKAWGLTTPFETLSLTEHGTRTHIFVYDENLRGVTAGILGLFATRRSIALLKRRYRMLAHALLQRLSTCSRTLTPQTYGQFADAYGTFTNGLNITAIMGRAGADHLTRLLGEHGVSPKDIPSTMATITYPTRRTPLYRSRLDLLRIGTAVQQRRCGPAQLTKRLRTWLSRYSHIPVNWCEEPWTEYDARAHMDELLAGSCAKELARLEHNHQEALRRRQTMLKRINTRSALCAYALGEATTLNEYRKNVFSKISLEMRFIFEYAAQRSGLSSWRDCYYLTSDEVAQCVAGTRTGAPALVLKRNAVAIVVSTHGDFSFLDASTTRRFCKFVHQLQYNDGSSSSGVVSVTGMSAQRGRVRGTAKVISGVRDFHKMKKGDILITAMTSVDFVPVMQMAAAFVTNEGGITSHASIVSREMGKPCVIGTKIATRVFQDGDTVEVDAEKGIVRKI